MVKICPKCKKKNNSDDDFCSKCGGKFRNQKYTIKSEKTDYTVDCPFCDKTFTFEADESGWESLDVTCPKCQKKTEFHEDDFCSSENKTHGIPALISFFCPGLGQIIKGHIGRGMLMIVGVLTGIIISINYFVLMQFSPVGPLIVICVWIWAVFDAYNSN